MTYKGRYDDQGLVVWTFGEVQTGSGDRIISGVQINRGFQVIGGVRIIGGVQIISGIQITNGTRIISGVQITNGTRIISGVQINRGIQTISGIRIISGVQIVSGVQTVNSIKTGNVALTIIFRGLIARFEVVDAFARGMTMPATATSLCAVAPVVPVTNAQTSSPLEQHEQKSATVKDNRSSQTIRSHPLHLQCQDVRPERALRPGLGLRSGRCPQGRRHRGQLHRTQRGHRARQ
ncbi:uncharacterized protein BO95DRAFT_148499 [Aspergillus brunneoviolaceus CBS 621.78]|uniref:Uncharacterized protein n=1 Tax=Aspergillus brunneoviolaceus CBS 621.78 TaxID=1450534 RepID=A0ACD1G7E1_9EURO|nr:hypothetical protein BO95DRAFT_148499 [Aspergillus brunneoviolaceus CBS 621.78]RAH45155.1 hypothetical protein BO95DRAFT_148499 [Aspergillus brunneoviolaceus CBS 621.78]